MAYMPHLLRCLLPVAISCSSDANLQASTWMPPGSAAMARLALESLEKTALAQSLGAAAKYLDPLDKLLVSELRKQ